jgi:DNA-binding response OmpR family regulator
MKNKILIVDDDRNIQELLRVILLANSYEVSSHQRQRGPGKN